MLGLLVSFQMCLTALSAESKVAILSLKSHFQPVTGTEMIHVAAAKLPRLTPKEKGEFTF